MIKSFSVKMKNGKPNILLLTYPRTGQHLLRSLLQSTNALIDWTHNIDMPQFIRKADTTRPFYDGSQTVITVVRDPLDSITSALVYDMYQNNYTLKNIKMFGGVIVDDYVKFWEYLLENADMFILYEDLISNNMGTLDLICKKLNLNVVSSLGKIIQDYEPNHMVSSLSSPLYLSVKDEVSKIDLKKCYDVYTKAKGLCITLEE